METGFRRFLTSVLLPLVFSGCVGSAPSSLSNYGRVSSKPLTASKSPASSGVVQDTTENHKLAPSVLASAVAGLRKSASPGQTTVSSPVPTPSPTSTPTPKPLPSPLPSLPAIAAQPFSVKTQTGLIGSAQAPAQNFVVLSAAGVEANTAVKVSSSAGVQSSPPPKTALYRALSLSTDIHSRWQQWQSTHPRPLKTRHYQLQSTARTLAKNEVVPFWVMTNFGDGQYQDVAVKARVAQVGKHCYILVDIDVDANAADTLAINTRAAEIASTFDNTIYPTNTRIFGNEANPGIDGDSHVYILLSPAVGNYGQDNTLGFFAQRDEFPANPNAELLFKHSNAKEMLYISSRIVLKGSKFDYLGTIAHEFQHMINFNQKVIEPLNTAPNSDIHSEEVWIDEGMAMYAIEANGYGLKSGGQVLANHVRKFQQDTDQFSLTDWNGNPDQSAYGAVYLFVVYLADRFGEDIIHEIISNNKTGIDNLNAILRMRSLGFDRVFHEWATANALDSFKASTDKIFNYTSLKMTGLNGSTKLSGFISLPELGSVPASTSFQLRPYTFRIFDLPSGIELPQIGVTSVAPAGTLSPLILTQ